MRYTTTKEIKGRFVVIKSTNDNDWSIVGGYETARAAMDAALILQAEANKAKIRVQYDWREFV